jgi:hypothetical protein
MHMNEIAQLALSIERDRIRRARKRSIEQKLLAGGELFEGACERMTWGIRHQFPHFNDAQVFLELQRRLDISRRLEKVK